MKKQIIAATAAVGVGIFLLFASKGFQANAKGEEDLRINGTTLTAYVGTDTFVSIPDTVTTIGEGAFAGNTTLQRVELPSGLQEIQYNAFGGCTALMNVTIPDSVTKVGPGAFKGCSALTMADLGKGITSWGSGVFNDCTSLDKLIVDDANTSLVYYNGALYNGDMSMLYQVLAARSGDSYAMPEKVKQIDTYAFWNMQNIKNVKVSPNVSTIPAYAMSSMGSVENVILPDSVTSISEKAFANDSSLKQVMIPASVKSIHDTELPTDFNDSNADTQEKPVIKHTEISEEVQEEDGTQTGENDSQQSTSSSVASEENPLDTKETGVIGKTRIVNGKAVVLIGKSNQKVYGYSQKSEEDAVEESSATEQTQTAEADLATKETEETDKIKQRAFYKQKNLTNYTISEKIKEIGRLSFAQSGLKKIEISDNVETIEYGAFYGCESLEEVVIPDTVTSIGTKAFAQTPWLDNWMNGERGKDEGDFLIVGDGILLAYRGTASKVTIPSEVKQIGSEVFKEHQELTQVTIPDSVTKIGADAFRNCSNLTKVDGGKNLKTVARGAFYGTQVEEGQVN